MQSYAGIYSYTADVIFHSFGITFPNSNEMFCSAYTYNKGSGDCLGYYGDDYASLQTSVVLQNTHDSGIIYEDACAPAPQPSAAPIDTAEPTIAPSSLPSEQPSRAPITASNELNTTATTAATTAT
eukprot:202555_1